jgi:hypothetical protein
MNNRSAALALTPYEVRNLVEHLVRAGRGDAVHRLLTIEEPHGSMWYEIKQQADDERGYEGDLSVAWRLADEQFCLATGTKPRAAAICLQIRYALIAASLRATSADLTTDVLRNRVRTGVWTMARARIAATRLPDPVDRAEMLGFLAATADVTEQAQVIADALADPSRRVVLPAIAERLPAAFLPSVVAAARETRSDDATADALAAVTPYLDAAQVEGALADACSIQSGPARARAVAALVPRAPDGFIEDAVLAGHLFGDDNAALAVLETVATQLSPAAAERALQAIGTFAPSARRSRLAATLSRSLPPSHRTRALRPEHEAARRIRARGQRASALAALGFGAEALEVIGAMSPADRVTELAEIAPMLSPALAREAIDMVAGLPSPAARSEALVSLSPVLGADSMLAALKLVETVKPPRARARMLFALAPALPEPRVTRALGLALAIRDVDARSVALAGLEPRLSARHRASARYRRRQVGTDQAEAILRSWDDAPTRSAAAARPEAKHGAADAGNPGQPAAQPDQAPEETFDGAVLRQRLADTVYAQQGDASLHEWFRSTLPPGGRNVDLGETRPAADGTPHAPANKSGRDALRQHLRKDMRFGHVNFADPKVLPALETVDGTELRTALHLGLNVAEKSDRDDEVQPGYPDVAACVPVFARHGRLHEVMDAARDLAGPYRRAEALTAALRYVTESDRPAIAAEAWTNVTSAARASSPRMWLRRLDLLAELAPFVGGADIARLARVLRTLADRLDERMPPADVARGIIVEAQLLLLLHATPRTASARAAEGLVTASLIRSEPIRTAVLAAFTPLLPKTSLAAAAAFARRLRDRHRRAERLAALAERASEVRAAGMASALIAQVAQLPGALSEPSMLGILADHAHLVTPSELARIWCPALGEGLLRDPGNESRDGLLAALDAFGPALTCLGGTGISASVDRTVRTVQGWWP